MKTDSSKTMQYLALGDSYTIGELVPAYENFPSQVYTLLKPGFPTLQPHFILAKTGWTTDELLAAIDKAEKNDLFVADYDLVTLLIGVNNQYRGRSIENYIEEFEMLLKKAIAFAGNDVRKVLVISIPDWGVTSFAENRDGKKIAQEIDAYNLANKKIADKYKVGYLNITEWTREAKLDKTLITTDGLHPSSKEYARWAKKIAAYCQALTLSNFDK